MFVGSLADCHLWRTTVVPPASARSTARVHGPTGAYQAVPGISLPTAGNVRMAAISGLPSGLTANEIACCLCVIGNTATCLTNPEGASVLTTPRPSTKYTTPAATWASGARTAMASATYGIDLGVKWVLARA